MDDDNDWYEKDSNSKEFMWGMAKPEFFGWLVLFCCLN